MESLAFVVETAISLHSCCSFVCHVESNVGPGCFILGCNDEYFHEVVMMSNFMLNLM